MFSTTIVLKKNIIIKTVGLGPSMPRLLPNTKSGSSFQFTYNRYLPTPTSPTYIYFVVLKFYSTTPKIAFHAVSMQVDGKFIGATKPTPLPLTSSTPSSSSSHSKIAWKKRDIQRIPMAFQFTSI